MALIIVLWMLTLLTVIASSMVFSSRTELQVAANLASLARAEAIADAAINKAIHELLAPGNDPSRWRGDGRTHSWRFRDEDVLVTIIDESGKIDINSAPDPLLKSLFRSAGLAETEADALLDAVLDWRDGDDLRRLHGAEANDYAAAGRRYAPANAPFETIEELRQVLGMTESLFQKIAGLVTVSSRQAGVNSAIAAREVLLAIPGVSVQQVDTYLAQRDAARDQGLTIPSFSPGQAYAAGDSGAVLSIRADARLADRTRFIREAVVRLSGGGDQGVSYLAWRAPSIRVEPSTENAAE